MPDPLPQLSSKPRPCSQLHTPDSQMYYRTISNIHPIIVRTSSLSFRLAALKTFEQIKHACSKTEQVKTRAKKAEMSTQNPNITTYAHRASLSQKGLPLHSPPKAPDKRSNQTSISYSWLYSSKGNSQGSSPRRYKN